MHGNLSQWCRCCCAAVELELCALRINQSNADKAASHTEGAGRASAFFNYGACGPSYTSILRPPALDLLPMHPHPCVVHLLFQSCQVRHNGEMHRVLAELLYCIARLQTRARVPSRQRPG